MYYIIYSKKNGKIFRKYITPINLINFLERFNKFHKLESITLII